MAETDEWTIMVYMAGDNNLSEEMIGALRGMIKLNSLEKVNLIAVYDGCYPSTPIKTYNFTKKNILTALGAKQRPPLSAFEEVEDTSADVSKTSRTRRDGDNLKRVDDFIRETIARFPAKRYGLIASGHSDGVIGKRMLPDNDSEAKLDLLKFRGAINKILPKDEKGNKLKLDLLGFDGCLMGMLEVAYELKDIAKVLVASQGNIPISGWNYQEMLSLLAENPAVEAKELAEHFVKQFADFNEDFAISGRAINISAYDLEALTPNDEQKKTVYNHIQNLAKIFCDVLILPELSDEELQNLTDEQRNERNLNELIREKFIDWITLSHYRSQTFMHNQAVDILDFTSQFLLNYRKWQAEYEFLGITANIDKSSSINMTVNTIQKRIKNIFESLILINDLIKEATRKFILRSCSVGPEYQFSQGVSLFLPWTDMAYKMIAPRYKKLSFNKVDNWLKFIQEISELTVRTPEKDLVLQFTKDFESLFKLSIMNFASVREVGGKEVGGKEVGGKEVGGKNSAEEFYYYFSQFRNYLSSNFERRCANENSFIIQK